MKGSTGNQEFTMADIQYISDENNNVTAVTVPIGLWQELQPEKETAYLLKSETMRMRLLEAQTAKRASP